MIVEFALLIMKIIKYFLTPNLSKVLHRLKSHFYRATLCWHGICYGPGPGLRIFSPLSVFYQNS